MSCQKEVKYDSDRIYRSNPTVESVKGAIAKIRVSVKVRMDIDRSKDSCIQAGYFSL